MKAILTKSRSNNRIKVQAEGVPHIVVSRDSLEGSEEKVHRAAALKLCEKYKWGTSLVSGGLPTPGQWVHCFGVSEDELALEKDRLADCKRQLVWVEDQTSKQIAVLEDEKAQLLKQVQQGGDLIRAALQAIAEFEADEIGESQSSAKLALKRALAGDAGIPVTPASPFLKGKDLVVDVAKGLLATKGTPKSDGTVTVSAYHLTLVETALGDLR